MTSAPPQTGSPDNDSDRKPSDPLDAAGPAPDSTPSRDDHGTTRCPVCRRCYTPVGRQLYCSTAGRKTAFRRRHQQPGPVVTVPTGRPRREITVYECPDCGERYLGEQRCEGCGTFARRVGIGGACPSCDGPVAISDLLDRAVVTVVNT